MPFEQFHPDQISTDQWTAGLNPRQKTEKLRQIREWCRNAGHDVPVKGKIPQAALIDYAASHKTPPQPAATDQTTEAVETAEELSQAGVSAADLPDAAPSGAALTAAEAPDLHPTLYTVADAFDPEALAEFSEAMAATRERLAAPVVPTVGMRARPRFDDGAAVVREVWMDNYGGGTLVRVTYLPDVHDEETWSSLDWLDRVTALLPAEDFSFDEFGSDDMAGDLRAWAQAGRSWTEYGTTQPPALPDLVGVSVPGPDQDRPEWGLVAESDAVERARDLAARMLDDNVELTRQRDSLEEHAADLRRALDQAVDQLGFLLRQWAAARDARTVLEERIRDLQRENNWLEMVRAGHRFEVADLTVSLDAARARITQLEDALEQARRPWWRAGR